MLDIFDLPSFTNADVQIFTRPSTVKDLQGNVWQKSRGVTMASMFCIGGGGGGGGGFTGTAGSARGGGGGGGSSGIARLIIPTHLLPDRLYIQVGAGGLGVGSGGGTAGSGVLSGIAMMTATVTVTSNNILGSSFAAPTGGVTGTGAAGGAGGAAGTIVTIGTVPWCGLGEFNFIAGQAGGKSVV